MKIVKPVVILTSNLYKPHIGGVENSLRHLAVSYQELGYQAIIITSDLARENGSLPDYEESNGIFIYRYSMSKAVNFMGVKLPGFTSGVFNAMSMYKKVFRLFQPKFIISRYHFNQVFCKLAGGRNTLYLVPGIVKYQNSSENIAKKNLKEYLRWHYHALLQYWALKSSSRIAVFSHNMAEQVNLVCKQSFPVLLTKPGVDCKRFSPLVFAEKLKIRKYLNNECQGKVFLCVGRCVKVKGFDLAIKAFVKLKGTEHQLWLVGDGALIDEYKTLALMLGLENQVVFWGVQSQPEIFYSVADFFIMSSIYEPLGQTILEGLSSGLPIVAFRPNAQVKTASNELITTEHGVFVEHPDADLLGNTLREVSLWDKSDYQKKSSSCRLHAINNFTWISLAKTLAKEFENEK